MKSHAKFIVAAAPLALAACAANGGNSSGYRPAGAMAGPPASGGYSPQGYADRQPGPAQQPDSHVGAAQASQPIRTVDPSAPPGATYPVPGSNPAAPGDTAPAQAPAASGQGYYPPQGGAGPRGSSNAAPGENRYDEVGYGISTNDAAGFGQSVMYVASNALPVDSFVEVTSLNNGRTVLAKVAARGPRQSDALIDLAPAVAQALGLSGGSIPVRVRLVQPTGQDAAAINSGNAAPARIDTPDTMLGVLRQKLPSPPRGTPVQARTSAAPPRAPAATAAPGASYSAPTGRASEAQATPHGSGYYVQIIALSDRAKAQSLADQAHGFLVPGGGLYRVRMGPYPTRAQAEKARSAAVSQGFSGARIYDRSN